MNCDDAFDLMTSRDSADSPALETHLFRCPRCREMRATLAPALDWLVAEELVTREADAKSAWDSKPLLTAQAVKVAERMAGRLPRRGVSSLGRVRQLATISSVALIGVLIGAFGVAAMPMSRDSRAAPLEPMLTACLWTAPGGRSDLVDGSSRGVVVSCVSCHVPASLD